jgi:hypothetical protein
MIQMHMECKRIQIVAQIPCTKTNLETTILGIFELGYCKSKLLCHIYPPCQILKNSQIYLCHMLYAVILKDPKQIYWELDWVLRHGNGYQVDPSVQDFLFCLPKVS